jgi:predicted O-methyltransferase YrrM
MRNRFDPQRFRELIEERDNRFPSLTLPPEFAELFEVNTLQLVIKLARYKFVARLIKKTDDVLEVGSGSGLGTIFLAQHAAHVTGLEIDKNDSTQRAQLTDASTLLSFINRSSITTATRRMTS